MSTSSRPRPCCNLTGLVFPEDQAGFLAGALAGLLTESNTLGAVLGTDQVPPVVAFKEGWENGAKYTNPEVNLISTYHPGGLDVAFTDPEWGATTARQALDNGADIVFGAGGQTGNGALIEVAREGGEALCVGVDTDQWETVPEAHPCLVTSAMKLITQGVVDLVDGGLRRLDRGRQLLRRGRPGRLPRPGRSGAGRGAGADGGDHRWRAGRRHPDRLRALARSGSPAAATGCGRLCRTPSLLATD